VFVGRWAGKRDRAQKRPHHREKSNLGTTGRRATDGQRLEAEEGAGQVIVTGRGGAAVAGEGVGDRRGGVKVAGVGR
jgi:hypothetical protein